MRPLYIMKPSWRTVHPTPLEWVENAWHQRLAAWRRPGAAFFWELPNGATHADSITVGGTR